VASPQRKRKNSILKSIRVTSSWFLESRIAAEDDKFDQPWRRDGPLPPRGGEFRSSRFEEGNSPRFREEKPPSASDTASDWRSNRAPPPPPPRFDDGPRPPRRAGLNVATGEPSAADTADTWTKGSKFTPSQSDAPPRGRFGSLRSEREFSTPPYRRESSAADDTGDWRSVMRNTRSDGNDKSRKPSYYSVTSAG
jgi:hypothetical protein